MSNSILDSIDTILLKSIPTYKREMRDKNELISNLESDKANLESENDSLKQEIESLKNKIDELVSNSSKEE